MKRIDVVNHLLGAAVESAFVMVSEEEWDSGTIERVHATFSDRGLLVSGEEALVAYSPAMEKSRRVLGRDFVRDMKSLIVAAQDASGISPSPRAMRRLQQAAARCSRYMEDAR